MESDVEGTGLPIDAGGDKKKPSRCRNSKATLVAKAKAIACVSGEGEEKGGGEGC